MNELPLDTIIRGDASEILPKFASESIDLVITDPPYKVSQRYGGGVDADNLIAVSSIFRVLPQIARVLKESGFLFVFYDNRILPLLFEAVKGTSLIYRKQLYLYRRWGLANRWVGWMQTTDPICVFVNGYEKPFAPKLKGEVKHDFYIKSGPESDDTGHPAQKPLEPILDMVSWCSDEGDVVLDPFMGSGTTCVAAKTLRRHWIGIDSNAEYCKIAEARLKSYTSQTVLFGDE
jgi:site-specific DNA-methyltransferase (adenine-specific)